MIIDFYFEDKDSNVVFCPDGKYKAGKFNSYIIKPEDDRQTVDQFLNKVTVYSFILILLFPIVLFGSIPFSELIFPQFGYLVSLIITFIIIIIFVIWYQHKVNKITKGFNKLTSRRKFSEVSFTWKMWLLGFIFTFIIVVEGLIAYSVATNVINTLK